MKVFAMLLGEHHCLTSCRLDNFCHVFTGPRAHHRCLTNPLRAFDPTPALSRAGALVPSRQSLHHGARRATSKTVVAAEGGRGSAAVSQAKETKERGGKVEKLDLAPPRGTRDFYPEDMRLQSWLFGEWREVARLFGFSEYDAPVLENEALYTRKAGEEVGLCPRTSKHSLSDRAHPRTSSVSLLRMPVFCPVYACVLPGVCLCFCLSTPTQVTQQLYNFEDKGERRVALRPEMTPSLARMVLAKKAALPLPLKWFSIPQCWRYERMTRGRRREHYQVGVQSCVFVFLAPAFGPAIFS